MNEDEVSCLPTWRLLELARNAITTLEAVSPAIRCAYTEGAVSDEDVKPLNARLDALAFRTWNGDPNREQTTNHHE